MQNENVKKREDRENESPTEREPADNDKFAARRTYWRKVMKDQTGRSSQLRVLHKQAKAGGRDVDGNRTPNGARRLRGISNLTSLMKQDVYIMTWTDLEYPFPQATRDKNMKTIVGWELERRSWSTLVTKLISWIIG